MLKHQNIKWDFFDKSVFKIEKVKINKSVINPL